MTSNSTKVLATARAVTQTSYRTAAKATIKALQGDDIDQDFADKWGMSAGTVKTVRNMTNDLSAVPLLNLGTRFGPSALNTVLNLIGAKAVCLETITLTPRDIAAIPCNVAATLPTLIRLLADGDASDADIRQLDREGVVDCFMQLADMLQQRRDALRLKVVGE